MDDKSLMEVVDRCRVRLDKSGGVLVDVPQNKSQVAAVLDSQYHIYSAGNVFHPSLIDNFLAHLSPHPHESKEEEEKIGIHDPKHHHRRRHRDHGKKKQGEGLATPKRSSAAF